MEWLRNYYGKKTNKKIHSEIYPKGCNFTQFIYLWKLLYMFRMVSLHPSSGRHTTVSTASDTCWNFTATYRCRGRIGTGLSVLQHTQTSSNPSMVTGWQVTDAVSTVVCPPDDEWRYHPKHVEQFPEINKLCKFAYCWIYTGLFISPSGISELDCATTKTDTTERSISIGRESLEVFFVLGSLAYFQVPPLGGSREKNGVHSE